MSGWPTKDEISGWRKGYRPTRSDLQTFSYWVLASVIYIGIGVAEPDFMLSFWVCMAYLLVVMWALPRLFRRLRGQKPQDGEKQA